MKRTPTTPTETNVPPGAQVTTDTKTTLKDAAGKTIQTMSTQSGPSGTQPTGGTIVSNAGFTPGGAATSPLSTSMATTSALTSSTAGSTGYRQEPIQGGIPPSVTAATSAPQSYDTRPISSGIPTTYMPQSALQEREQFLRQHEQPYGSEFEQSPLVRQREVLIARQREERERLLARQRKQREALEREQAEFLSSSQPMGLQPQVAPQYEEFEPYEGSEGGRIFKWGGREYILVDECEYIAGEEPEMPYQEVQPVVTGFPATAPVPPPPPPAPSRPQAAPTQRPMVEIVTTKTVTKSPHYERRQTTHTETLPADDAERRLASGYHAGPHHPGRGSRKYIVPVGQKESTFTSKPAGAVTGVSPTTTGMPETSPMVDVARTIAAGGMPSNAALNAVIDTTVATLEQSKTQTADPIDKQLVQDVENVLVSTQQLLDQRNQGEHFQRMVLHGKEAAKQLPLSREGLSTMGTGAPADLAADFRQLFRSLRTVLWALVQSPEFRRDFVELWNLLYDIVFFDFESGQLRPEFVPLREAAQGRKPLRQAFGETAGQLQQRASEAITAPSVGPTYEPAGFQETLPSGEQVLHYAGPPRSLLFYEPIYESVPGRQSDIRTQELFNRLVFLLRNLGEMQEWRSAVADMFTLFDHLKLSARHYGTQMQATAGETQADFHIRQMRNEAKLLLEEFAGPGGLDTFLRHTNSLWGQLRNDDVALGFFRDFRDFIRISVAQPGLADDPLHRQRGLDLIYAARMIGDRYRYHNDAQNALSELRILVDKIANDPVLRNFADNITRLIRDLTLDEYGRPATALTATHLRHLKSLLIPLINAHLARVPLPRVEANTAKYDFWADNMILNGKALTPDNVKIELFSKADFNVSTLSTTAQHAWGDADLTITLYNVEILLENINFWFRRKRFPKIEDEGTAVCDVRGTGATILIRLSTYGDTATTAQSNLPHEARPLFHVRQVVADFDRVNINIQRAAHHKFLLNMMTLIFRRTIKRNVELRIEQVLQKVIDAVNERVAAARYRFTTSSTGLASRAVSALPVIGPKIAPLMGGGTSQQTVTREE